MSQSYIDNSRDLESPKLLLVDEFFFFTVCWEKWFSLSYQLSVFRGTGSNLTGNSVEMTPPSCTKYLILD